MLTCHYVQALEDVGETGNWNVVVTMYVEGGGKLKLKSGVD